MRHEEEQKVKLQDQIIRLEEQLERTKYDKSYSQIDNETKLKAKDMQFLQMKDELEIYETFTTEIFKRF